jgi:phosphopantetheinyl transferase
VSSRLPARHEVSQSVPPDVTVFEDVYDTANMRDYISRRYLTASERSVYEALPPKQRRKWLSGRVAAKDAVRCWMRLHRGVQVLFPQELCIANDDGGAPHVVPNISTTVPATLRLSIAHKDQIAVAIVGEHEVGIDIERIELRDETFAATAFSTVERALLSSEDEALALTRGWVVKEAAAKAVGKGLGGRPQDFTIEQRDGDCFRVGDRWYVTHRLREHVIGWSLPSVLSAKGDTSQGEDVTLRRQGFGGITNEHRTGNHP